MTNWWKDLTLNGKLTRFRVISVWKEDEIDELRVVSVWISAEFRASFRKEPNQDGRMNRIEPMRKALEGP